MSSDNFPLLDIPELVTCLQECDFSLATIQNVERPSSQFVITLYKQIIDTFMGVSPDSLLEDSRNFVENGDTGEQEVYGASLVYHDTLKILALNKICYKFFLDIGVSDFNVMDLYKPDPHRTRRFLSAVANYARFREEAMLELDGDQHPDGVRYLEQTDNLLKELRLKFDANNILYSRVQKYKEFQKSDDLEALESDNKHMESELRHLNQVQEALTVDYERYKAEKQKHLSELETLGYELIELESERDKLRKYSQTDAEVLRKGVRELSLLLEQQQVQLEKLEQKQKNLQISLETFQASTQELYEVLQIVSTDLQDSHLKESTLLDAKHKLMQNHKNLNNLLSAGIMAKITLLQEQLDSQKRKLAELELNTQAKESENSATLKRLRKQHTEEILPEVRNIEQRYTTKVADTITNYESQMRNIRADFDNEVALIETECSLLFNHIKNYMTTIGEKLA
ncbi:AaceriAEL015Wp [[Ashbya] aceris (nom. inval.)]|nr:AaceriAEL015Wp [[Ashbya] aceris (nom. inval.)]